MNAHQIRLAATYLLMYGLLVRSGHSLFAALAITNHLLGAALLHATRNRP